MRRVFEYLHDHRPCAWAGACLLRIVIDGCLPDTHLLNDHTEYERNEGDRGPERGRDKQRI